MDNMYILITGITGILSALIPSLLIYNKSQALITYRLEQLEKIVKNLTDLNERVLIIEEKLKNEK